MVVCELCDNEVYLYDAKEVYTFFTGKWQATQQNTCKKCHQTTWVNNESYCHTCREPARKLGWRVICKDCLPHVPKVCVSCDIESEVLTEDNTCIPCAYGRNKGWTHNPQYSDDTLRQCVMCARKKVLDLSGLCLTCFTQDQLSFAPVPFVRTLHTCKKCDEFIPASREMCSRHQHFRRNCADCNEVFTANYEMQWQCEDCLPKCCGCRQTFVPLLRSDKLCVDCLARKNANICTDCGDKQYPKQGDTLTEEGWCFNCLDRRYDKGEFSGDQICWRCHSNLVVELGDVCSECLNKHFECPSCLRKNMNYERVICHECSDI